MQNAASDMSEKPERENLQKKWNCRYSVAEGEPRAARVLQENSHLLPVSGDALDLACGLGGNALFLAKRGLSVQAWDLSSVAIETLQLRATAETLPLKAVVRDVIAQPPSAAAFDVIVVGYFLQRELTVALCAALRPGGLLFYQTFIKERVTQQGPNNPDFLLAENELLTMFAPLRVRLYREEGRVGNIAQGLRNEALFIGQKME